MTLNGYDGPTSGRITVGGGKGPEIERFFDPPLNRDERNALADWLALSPNAQAREVRVLRWNLAEMTSQRDALRNTVREQDRELLALRAELATHTPEGFQLPPAAADLLAHATAHGWQTAKAWIKSEDPEAARLEVAVRHGRYMFQLIWSCQLGGGGHMIRRGLARAPMRDWHDAPSLIKIKKIIEEIGTQTDE